MKKLKTFIQNISWCKDYRFLFCKHKRVCFQIVYSGWHFLNFRYRIIFYDHAGFHLDLEFLGVDYSFEFYDHRHYNRIENRFYLDDEPKYRGDEKKYLSAVQEFIKRHPEIDSGYYGRCLEKFASVKDVSLKDEKCPPPKKDYKKAKINWKEVYKGGWSCKSKYVYENCMFKIKEKNKKQIIRTGFLKSEIMDKKKALLWLDLYDKKGNLISCRDDYDI